MYKRQVIYRRLHIPFERGELVVFHQEQLGYDCIKRIVAVGGDTVDIPGDGQVYLNGEPLSEPYLYMTSTPVSYTHLDVYKRQSLDRVAFL